MLKATWKKSDTIIKWPKKKKKYVVINKSEWEHVKTQMSDEYCNQYTSSMVSSGLMWFFLLSHFIFLSLS